MIYDDVENGDEGGNSSLEYGWSSSEFESYEEQSDSECKNGVPRSFLRSSHKKQVCAQPAWRTSVSRRFLGDRTGKCVLSHTLYVVISQTSMCSLGNIGYHRNSLSALSTEGSGCYILVTSLLPP